MKILLVDIETAPNLCYLWGLWNQNVSIDKIVNSGYVLCWSAKWYGEPLSKMRFSSVQKGTARAMLLSIHKLLDEADAVCHYNGSKFDIPTLNKEFVTHGMKPPSPYHQIDLWRVVKKHFRFPSSKLDYVAQTLGLGAKVRHAGFELWVRCMQRDPAAWRSMEQYNRGDVALLERLYDRLLPWISSHPNHGAFDEGAVCPNCGSGRHSRMGTRINTTLRYARYQCRDCGKWFRGTKAIKTGRATYTGIS